MTAYEIDSVTIFPQPDEHEWEPEKDGVLGFDGNGNPIKKKFRQCILRSRRALAYQAWSQFDDGSSHTLTLPQPNTLNNWASYTTCYVGVTHGVVRNGAAFDGIEIVITGAEAY